MYVNTADTDRTALLIPGADYMKEQTRKVLKVRARLTSKLRGSRVLFRAPFIRGKSSKFYISELYYLQEISYPNLLIFHNTAFLMFTVYNINRKYMKYT